MMKVCRRCKIAKPVSTGFYDRVRSTCKTCRGEMSTAWRKKNPIRSRESAIQRQYPYKYGITYAEVQRRKEEQQNLCFLCRCPVRTAKRGLCVDHHHSTKKIRKLLCDGCNKGLGHFAEKPDLLHRAAEYLIAHDSV